MTTHVSMDVKAILKRILQVFICEQNIQILGIVLEDVIVMIEIHKKPDLIA